MIIRFFVFVLLLSALFWFVFNRFLNRPIRFIKVFVFVLITVLAMTAFLLGLSTFIEG